MKGHSMTNPQILAADTPKPDNNAPSDKPASQPDTGAPMKDKPEEKPTSGK